MKCPELPPLPTCLSTTHFVIFIVIQSLLFSGYIMYKWVIFLCCSVHVKLLKWYVNGKRVSDWLLRLASAVGFLYWFLRHFGSLSTEISPSVFKLKALLFFLVWHFVCMKLKLGPSFKDCKIFESVKIESHDFSVFICILFVLLPGVSRKQQLRSFFDDS